MSKVQLAQFVSDGIGKFGAHLNVGEVLETVWPPGGMYRYLPFGVAKRVAVSSNNSEDTIEGTGAQKAKIFGCDVNYLLIDEVVDLQGLTHAITSQEFHRVWRGKVVQAGINNKQLGRIFVKNSDDLDHLLARIDLSEKGDGQTLMALWTVPAGGPFFLNQLYVSSNSETYVNVDFWVRPLGQVWQIKRQFTINAGHYVLPVPRAVTKSGKIKSTLVIDEKSDIEFTCQGPDKAKENKVIVVKASFDGFY